MSKQQKIQIPAMPDLIPDIKINPIPLEQFTNDKGIVFEHWCALPSPIGKKNRGEYRRSDSLDTVAEGGFIYQKVGEFNCVLVGDQHANQHIDGGIYDNNTARIILPKYYKKHCSKKQSEIALLPGDRIYPKNIELKVPNYQESQYNPDGVDVLQFPISCVEILIDSNNIAYQQGKDFSINKYGNIKWLAGGKNPGIDPDTKKGRVYSIRYKYLAFWYIKELINEIRVTNDNDGNAVRLPYHATILREYIYHNKNNSNDPENATEKTSRTIPEPKEKVINADTYQVKVDVKDFE